jgi:hypothetical protein
LTALDDRDRIGVPAGKACGMRVHDPVRPLTVVRGVNSRVGSVAALCCADGHYQKGMSFAMRTCTHSSFGDKSIS